MNIKYAMNLIRKTLINENNANLTPVKYTENRYEAISECTLFNGNSDFTIQLIDPRNPNVLKTIVLKISQNEKCHLRKEVFYTKYNPNFKINVETLKNVIETFIKKQHILK